MVVVSTDSTITFLWVANIFLGGGRNLSCHDGGDHRPPRTLWAVIVAVSIPHTCSPFRRRACFDDRPCAPLVLGTSPERPTSRPVSRPRSTKIRGGQIESEAQPLAVPITTDWCQKLLKIGTVVHQQVVTGLVGKLGYI